MHNEVWGCAEIFPTSLNISISTISCRFPPSLIAFGFMNYFNWFIYYHVTELGGKENPTLILL